LAEQIKLGLFTLRRWEKCAVSFASPTSPSGRYRLVALTRFWDLFVCARNLFDEAMQSSLSLCQHNSRYGSDEQMFGAEQQVLYRGLFD
jgi:hypothetical protein